jgi:hypothetical protein
VNQIFLIQKKTKKPKIRAPPPQKPSPASLLEHPPNNPRVKTQPTTKRSTKNLKPQMQLKVSLGCKYTFFHFHFHILDIQSSISLVSNADTPIILFRIMSFSKTGQIISCLSKGS